jgi:prolipoprotein diacylglyceryl transferase
MTRRSGSPSARFGRTRGSSARPSAGNVRAIGALTLAPITAELGSAVAAIPPPPFRDLELGPLSIRMYALWILLGILAAATMTYYRWKRKGHDPEIIFELTLVSVFAGLIGGRIYHVITSPDQLGDEWYAPFAIWEGGLGIWGAVALGVAAGAVYVRWKGESVLEMMDAAAPGILLAQAIGRLGNYFNQELFGSPTDLPWGLEVDPAFRPAEYVTTAAFHPTFLYEMLWNLAGVVLLLLIDRRFRINPPGIFALYVAWYSLGRIFWESLRIDPANEILGQRVNFWVAIILLVGAVIVFIWAQRRAPAPASRSEGGGGSGPGSRTKVKRART